MDIIRKISDLTSPPLIVAELSGNHGGDINKAFSLLESAIKSGADAIKLQTYKPDTITVKGLDDRFLLKDGLWKGRYLYDLYRDAMTPWEWHKPLSDRAEELGAFLFSSPFDESAVEFLESTLNPLIHKVASFELNHLPLLQRIGETKKVVFASVGVSNLDEIEKALDTLRSSGCPEVVLLHCVSEYPAKCSDFNLASIIELKKRFGSFIGLSDHSYGHTIAVSSTVLGVRVIEKHFTLDRNQDSIDGDFSMLPEEFRHLVDEVKVAHFAMGNDKFYDDRSEAKGANFKRSILVSSSIKKNEILTSSNIRVARPSDGLCPSYWYEVLGTKALHDMEVGHPLSFRDFKK